ncbi:MAG: DUF427 domain-containing protein [Nocardioidaceae bacterium]
MTEPAWPPDPDYRDFPAMIAEPNRVEPAPRRVRGVLAGKQIFDTRSARYVWEWPNYPQYYIPLEDIDRSFLVDERRELGLRFGSAHRHGLDVGDKQRPGSVRLFSTDAMSGVANCARFDWDALDAWYEEDEQVFVHPRNPYVRVDALRSHRHVRVELDGTLLAETTTPVLLFETGLPTRYYIDRSDVAFEHLVHSDTESACPYKGVTTDYWSVRLGEQVHQEHADLVWSYSYPTRQVLPIAGLVAFYNEKVDIHIDGTALPRPRTHLIS